MYQVYQISEKITRKTAQNKNKNMLFFIWHSIAGLNSNLLWNLILQIYLLLTMEFNFSKRSVKTIL